MENHGIAVATICTDEFYALGTAEAEALGMAGLPIAVVPHPVAKLPAERVAKLAAVAVDEIVHIFGTDSAELQATYRAKTVAVKDKLRYHSMFESNFNEPDSPQRLKGPDSWEAINRLFYRRGWTDGLHIVTRPEEVMIVVAGGAGRHSAIIPSFGGTTKSVTVPVLDANGDPM